jgi:hypothetical protein
MGITGRDVDLGVNIWMRREETVGIHTVERAIIEAFTIKSGAFDKLLRITTFI